MKGLGLRVVGLVFRVSGSGFRVEGLTERPHRCVILLLLLLIVPAGNHLKYCKREQLKIL